MLVVNTKRSLGKLFSMSSTWPSLTGVTGARSQLAEGISGFIETIRRYSDKPLAIGFGISNPQQAQAIGRLADGVIVGSAIIDVIEEHLDQQGRLVEAVGEFVGSLRRALDEKGS